MHAAWLPHPATLTLAAAAVITGAPLFSEGLRALRLRRRLARLQSTGPDAGLPDGLAHIQGRVVLESPLFAPLSRRPCAGWQLEVRGIGAPVARTAEVHRAFGLRGRGEQVHVAGDRAQWRVAVTAEHVLAADEPVSGTLEGVLGSLPEAMWWRRAGGRLELREHALFAETECHVVGTVQHAAVAIGESDEEQLLATGTADAVPASIAAAPPSHVSIGAGEPYDLLLVSDTAPAPESLAVPWHRVAGVFLGPAISLAGLLYLAHAADQLRQMARF